MLRVTNVEPLDGYRLRVAFNDGVVRDVDCAFRDPAGNLIRISELR